jgi:hypothetical protein
MTQRMLCYFVLWEVAIAFNRPLDKLLPGSRSHSTDTKRAVSLAMWILNKYFSVPTAATQDFFRKSRKTTQRCNVWINTNPLVASQVANVVKSVEHWVSILRR